LIFFFQGFTDTVHPVSKSKITFTSFQTQITENETYLKT
jgi:hypothetical protein